MLPVQDLCMECISLRAFLLHPQTLSQFSLFAVYIIRHISVYGEYLLTYTNHSHSFFRILICNVSACAYHDPLWLVTRTQNISRNNLLNRIFITRRRMTVYAPNAKFTQRTVIPLAPHYDKNKHSLLNYNRVV